jgi:hypothetical protein
MSCKKNGLEVENDVEDVRIFQIDSGGTNNQGIVLLSDNNLLLYGGLNIFNINRFTFIKYSPEGKMIWDTVYAPLDQIFIYKVLPLEDGQYVTIGTNVNEGTILTNWFDGNGHSIRSVTYSSPASNHELTALIDKDGNIVIVGVASHKFLLLKYSQLGMLLLDTLIDDGLSINKFSIRMANDDFDNYYMQGRFNNSGHFNNYLMKVSSNGVFQWYDTLLDDNSNSIQAGCLVSDDTIHAFSTKGPGDDVKTGIPFITFVGNLYHDKYDVSGHRISDIIVDQLPANCIFTSLTPTSDKGCLLAGTTNYFGGDFVSPSRVILVKFDSDFNFQWSKIIETYVPALGIDAVETSNSYYVSGTSLFADSIAYMMLLKTPAN